MKREAPHVSGPLRSEAFMEHAIERHRGAVIRFAMTRTRSAADAQDIAQDVFIKLLRSTVGFHNDDHLRAWLLRATHDSCVDLHRQAWRKHVDTYEDMGRIVDRTISDAAIEQVTDHPVWQAMGRLPDKLRCTLHLHYVEGCSTTEVAEIMGCTEAATRTRLHRGRKKLATELVRLGYTSHSTVTIQRAAVHPGSPTDTTSQSTAY